MVLIMVSREETSVATTSLICSTVGTSAASDEMAKGKVSHLG